MKIKKFNESQNNMKRTYKFTIATNNIGSEYSQKVVLDFDEDATEEDIENQVSEAYTEWLNEHNCGGYEES